MRLAAELGEPGLQAAREAMRQLLAASEQDEASQLALADLLVGPSDALAVLRMLHALVAGEAAGKSVET